MSAEKCCVFGGGTWGTTLACLLHGKGHSVRLWEYDPKVVASLKETRRPHKLESLEIPNDILITGDLSQAAEGAEHYVIVTPSHGVRELAKRLAALNQDAPPRTIVTCAKGIEPDTGLVMTDVVASEMGENERRRLAALSGPSHAEEVSRDMPTTVVSAAEDATVAAEVQALFNTERFRVYTSDDPLGVELGAALKNVIAIAVGICDGMGFGDNSRAALITRGMAEITRLGVQMGARPETFSGLAGIGDLIVTATSRHSRNRNFGELLGQGVEAEEARERIGMEVEGRYAARSAQGLADRHGVDMPISRQVYEILYEGKNAEEAVSDLLSREPKPEIYH